MSRTRTNRWDEAGTVGSFSTAGPNQVLVEFVRLELARGRALRILDVGCGAARNAIPMAALGATVIGTDVSWPMLAGARRRVASEDIPGRVDLVRVSMDRLPVANASAGVENPVGSVVGVSSTDPDHGSDWEHGRVGRHSACRYRGSGCGHAAGAIRCRGEGHRRGGRKLRASRKRCLLRPGRTSCGNQEAQQDE